MVTTIYASSLSLKDVQQQFQLKQLLEKDYNQFLELPTLTDIQQERIGQIRSNWMRHSAEGKVAEGEVKVLAISPLLIESGYFSESDLRLSLEERVREIEIEDGDRVIRGRMDLLVCRDQDDQTPLCVLVIEAKNSGISTLSGLPQLLFYMQTFLERQDFVWGLVTNGEDYVFVRLERGVFRQFRALSLTFPDEAERLLQVAIGVRVAGRSG